MDDASSEFRHVNLVKFEELVASLNLTMKNDIGLFYTNWSRAGAIFLMSPRWAKPVNKET